jgi:glycosyltransferase involved in cell wall biosynthesis
VRRKIRILVDSLADEGLINAQMTNAREIIRRLDSERFEISVFCVGKPDSEVAARPGVRLIQLPGRKQTITIVREFVTGTHEILFYMKSSPASRLYAQLRRCWRDARTTIGTIESQSNLQDEPTITAEAVSLWERTVLTCDWLFSNSDSVKRSLKSVYGLESDVVPTGVDTSYFFPLNSRAPNSRPVVLFVGSLRPFKGPHVVLDAATQFPEADFRIVGEGVIGEELRTRARREGIRNISFLGALSTSQTKQQYQSADIFLFPSRWEGSPKVLLEAAACGLPIVARNDYAPETVLHGHTGFAEASDGALLTRLAELLAKPALRNEFGRAGRQHSLSFDWDLITRKWEEVFCRLAPSQNVRLTA